MLTAFDELYGSFTEAEQKQFMQTFVERIDIYPEKPENGCWIRVPAKLRCIDPLMLEKGRVSQWSSQCRALLEEFQQTRFDYWVGCDT